MTPEQDPAVCAELDHAVELIAKLARHSHVQHLTAGKHDPGPVPARIPARLAGLVARYGFTMRREDLPQPPGQEYLGCACGDWPVLDAKDRMTVQVLKGMSAASEARVMAHEAAHVILGHVGLTPSQAIMAMIRRTDRARHNKGRAEDPGEEAAAELAAGAFCKVTGIGTGKFTRSFINQKTGSKHLPPEVLAAAKLAARILYAAARPALTERNAA